MTKEFPYEDVDPVLSSFIRNKVLQFAAKLGDLGPEASDIEQHIYLKLIEQMRIDSANSPRGDYLDTVVDRLLSNYFREFRAPSRRPQRRCSLSIVIGLDEDSRLIELVATIGEREHDARLFRRRRSAFELFELRHDVAAFLAKLSPRDRDLCKRLMRATPSQVARDLKIPRSTLQEQLYRLRMRCIDDSLEEYL